jgi:hypothetical protein
MDAKLALQGALSDRLEEIELLAGGAVMLCADQQINTAASALLVEQLIEVRLAIHYTDLARIGQLGRQLVAFAKPRDPGEGLLIFDRYGRRGAKVVFGSRCWCRTLSPQHTERQALGAHHKRRMQVQPALWAPVWLRPMTPSPSHWASPE